MKVVKILWIDSCASNLNWTIAEDIDVKPMFIETFGVVVEENEEYIAVAQNYGDDPEQYCNIMTIPKGCIKELFVIHENNVCEKEQKPTEWSEEDDYMLESIISDFAAGHKSSIGQDKWLKSLKDRVQPKQEWSEEDESKIVKLKSLIAQCNGFNKENRNKAFELIDSIKPRHTWEPSKEQMEYLHKYAEQNNYDGAILASLYSDLKQLKQL